jgi:hypothetical protein
VLSNPLSRVSAVARCTKIKSSLMQSATKKATSKSRRVHTTRRQGSRRTCFPPPVALQKNLKNEIGVAGQLCEMKE